MAIYMSVISKNLSTLIDTAIHTVFQPHRIHFHSFGLAVFTAMQSVFPGSIDFCFADIGSEVSDVFLVKKGVLLESVSVPCGKNSFIRRVADDFDIGPAVALSHIKLLIDKQADPTLAQKIEQSLVPMRDEWVAHLTVALESLGRDRSLPDTLYVTVDEDVATLFVEYAGLVDATGISLSSNRLVVTPVLYEVCAPHLKKTANMNHDIFLAIEALHVDRLLTLPEEER